MKINIQAYFGSPDRTMCFSLFCKTG